MEKTWDVPGGQLVYIDGKASIKTKGVTRKQEPLVTLYFRRGSKLVTQAQASKICEAFSAAMLRIVVTERQLEISLMGAVRDLEAGYALIDDIVAELHLVIAAEKRRQAASTRTPVAAHEKPKYVNRSR